MGAGELGALFKPLAAARRLTQLSGVSDRATVSVDRLSWCVIYEGCRGRRRCNRCLSKDGSMKSEAPETPATES